MAKTPKKDAGISGKTTGAKDKGTIQQAPVDSDRKINPWIPIAVVVFIVALIALMAAMSSSSSDSGDNGTTTASGTTQSGSTGAGTGETVDTSWITLETTGTQVSEETGIPAKMLQQFLGIAEADMNKPFSQIGGDETLANAKSLVAQFGGGGMGGSTGSSGAPSGMGGTTSP